MAWDGMGAMALPGILGLKKVPNDAEHPQGTSQGDTAGAAQGLTPNTQIFGGSARTFQPMESFTHFGILLLA